MPNQLHNSNIIANLQSPVLLWPNSHRAPSTSNSTYDTHATAPSSHSLSDVDNPLSSRLSFVVHGPTPYEAVAIPRRRARSRQLRKTYLFEVDGHAGETRELRRVSVREQCHCVLSAIEGHPRCLSTFLCCDDALML